MSEFPRKTVESFVDHRFGFPVELQNVELIQVFDDWLPDVNANALREAVFAALVVKPARWTGAEVRFVRLSQRMTQTEFAELVGNSPCGFHLGVFGRQPDIHGASNGIHVAVQVLEEHA